MRSIASYFSARSAKQFVDDALENKEQLEFIGSGLCNLKLLGVPGGGKTRCIIRHVLSNLKAGRYVTTQDYLVLTFSKSAQTDFVQKGQRQSASSFSDHNVRTIHSFALYIMNNILGTKVTPKNESVNLYVIKAMDLLNNNKFEVKHFPHYSNLKMIYVDEAQDISYVQYAFIKLIAEKFRTYLTLIGDPNQNIYQFQGGSDKYLLEFKADKEVQLVKNYRTSQSIVPIFNAIAPHPTNMSGVFDNGVKPRIFRGSVREILQDIGTELLEKKGSRGIIGPVKRSFPTNDNNYRNIGLSLIINYLENRGIGYQQLYSDDNMVCSKVNLKKIDYGLVHLHTVHTSKGLEYDHTFVLNFHHNTFTRPPTKQEFYNLFYLWYVALTRCKKSMTIYVLNDSIPFFSISQCERNYFSFNRRIDIPDDPEELPYSAIGAKNFMSLDELMTLVASSPVNERRMRSFITVDEVEGVANNYDLLDYNKYAPAYNIYFSLIYAYYYGSDYVENYNVRKEPLLHHLYSKYTNCILIPPELMRAYREAVHIYAPIKSDAFAFDNFKKLYCRFNQHVKDLYRFIIGCLERRGIDPESNPIIFLYIDNNVQSTDFDYPIELIVKIWRGEEVERNAFYLCIFDYQFRYEKKYMMELDLGKHIEALGPFLQQMRTGIGADVELFGTTDFRFSVPCGNDFLDIENSLSLLAGDWVVTFCSGKRNDYLYCNKAYLAFVLYCLSEKTNNRSLDMTSLFSKKIMLYNLLTNKKYVITMLDIVQEFANVLCAMAEISGLMLQDLLIFYDLETTGRDAASCAITECYLHIYTLDIPLYGSLVKTDLQGRQIIQSAEVVALTGINNEELCNEGVPAREFQRQLQLIYRCFNKNCEFAAYNGIAFDHKIMQRYLPDFNQYRCTDALQTIRTCYLSVADIWADRKLANVYRRICGREPKEIHRARADVLMLRDIYRALNI